MGVDAEVGTTTIRNCFAARWSRCVAAAATHLPSGQPNRTDPSVVILLGRSHQDVTFRAEDGAEVIVAQHLVCYETARAELEAHALAGIRRGPMGGRSQHTRR